MSASADAQPLLPDIEPETAYDTGHRHAVEGRLFNTRRIPADQRRAYARGYARGGIKRAQKEAGHHG